ncbi:MAG: hypothetical protein QXE31_00785 [Candidatus Woesearchaeota archaeon]
MRQNKEKKYCLKNYLYEFKEGFKEFGENISILVNSVLLSLVYFTGVGITSIIAKIFKKSFLDTKINKKAKTYWHDLNLEKRPIEEYYRQF